MEVLSVHEITEKEGVSVDRTEIAVIQKNGDSSTLILRNSFDLLVAESELPLGEAMPFVKDLTNNSKEMFIADSGNVEKVSKEKVGLNQSTDSEVPCELENRSSKFEVLNSYKPLREYANGRLSPISAPSTLEQNSNSGRRLFPRHEVESFSKGEVKGGNLDMPDPMPQPITTYHDNLTSDKLPFSHVLIPASVTSPICCSLKKCADPFQILGR